MSTLKVNTIQNTSGATLSLVKQVVQTVKSSQFTSTTKGSYVPVTGLSASVTPSATNSKILVTCEVGFSNDNNYSVFFHIYRNGVQITPNGPSTGFTPSDSYSVSQSSADTRAWMDQQTLIFLDSPNTTSAVTYQVYAAKPSIAVGGPNINPFGSSNITLMEIAG